MDKQILCAEECEVDIIGRFNYHGRTRTCIVVACEICGKHVASRLDQRKRFCSKQCVAESARVRVKLQCDFCDIEYQEKPSKVNVSKSGMNFCSRECKDNAQRLSSGSKFDGLRPAHYGTSDGSSGYRRTAFANLPHICADCGWKQIPQILEAHHKDRDHNNINIDNLVLLCPTCHVVRHYLARDGKFGKKKGAMV